MKYCLLLLMVFLSLSLWADEGDIDLSDSSLFVPFDQSEEYDYPDEFGVDIKTGGGLDGASGGGQYVLVMDLSGARGIDVDKKIRYFDLHLSLESTGNDEVGEHGNFNFKINPIAISFDDVFGTAFNGVVELGALPIEFGRDHNLDQEIQVKFYLISLKSEQIIPLDSMTLIMKEAINLIGYNHTSYLNETKKDSFSPATVEVELELQINNIFSLIAGASIELGHDQKGKVYGGLELGVDLGSTAVEFFVEGGYQMYQSGPGHGYVTLGIKLGTVFAFDRKKKD